MKSQLVKQFRVIIIACLLLGIGLYSVGQAEAAEYQSVPQAGVFINGKAVNGINPIKIDGVYYLPFTQLAKILGYNDIKFESSTLTYEVTDGSTKIRTTMGGSQAKKGNEYVNIKPPRWINNTAYISLHGGGALFNVYITFKSENGSIQIQKPARQYVVHYGDSLWNIARLHHISVNELKAENNLTSNIIKDGQILRLPSGGSGKEMEPVKEQQPIEKTTYITANLQRKKVIEAAKQYIGADYKFGASLSEAPHLFDCSSYTMLCFQQAGINLPRVSRDQASKGIRVTSLKMGDLMFFTNNDIYSDGRVSHVGIYMGDGSMIHASTSQGVAITKNVLSNPYWSKNYLFSKRVIQ